MNTSENYLSVSVDEKDDIFALYLKCISHCSTIYIRWNRTIIYLLAIIPSTLAFKPTRHIMVPLKIGRDIPLNSHLRRSIQLNQPCVLLYYFYSWRTSVCNLYILNFRYFFHHFFLMQFFYHIYTSVCLSVCLYHIARIGECTQKLFCGYA